MNCLATIRWKLLHLIVQLAGLLFLLGSEMFPDFHAAERAILLLRRHAIEAL
jgi:hypothetical protein